MCGCYIMPDILLVIPVRREGRWAGTEATSLPGEGPSILGRCNYDTLSPKRCGDACVMGRGPTDEAVVIVKPGAEDAAVTQLRANHRVSGKEAGGEGWNM